MADLNLVVDLHTITNFSVFESAPIYRATGTDLDIVAYFNSTELIDFNRLATIECKTKPIGTDYRARMNLYVFPKTTP